MLLSFDIRLKFWLSKPFGYIWFLESIKQGKNMLRKMNFLYLDVMEKGEWKNILRKEEGKLVKDFSPHFPQIKVRKVWEKCIPQESTNHITVDGWSLCKKGIEYHKNGMVLKSLVWHNVFSYLFPLWWVRLTENAYLSSWGSFGSLAWRYTIHDKVIPLHTSSHTYLLWTHLAGACCIYLGTFMCIMPNVDIDMI